MPWTGHFSYNFSPLMRNLSSFKPLSVVPFTSSLVNVLTPGCAPRTARPFKLASPSTPPSHFRPSTWISPRLRSPLTRIFFALSLSACDSASTSALRLSRAVSASRPASRLLWRVGRSGSRLTGSRFTRGVLWRFGFGGAGFGMILSAVVLMPLRIALLLAMFSRRLRSNALMTGSFFGGMVAG